MKFKCVQFFSNAFEKVQPCFRWGNGMFPVSTFLFVLTALAFGQQRDEVHLKNGAVYRGAIVREIPNREVAIRLENNTQVDIKMDDVREIKKNVNGFHKHDGFFLSFNLGLAYSFGRFTPDSSSSSWTYEGTQPFSVTRIGGTLKKEIVLSFDILSYNSSSKSDAVNFGGGGMGLTYYLMPYNLFGSSSLGLLLHQTAASNKPYQGGTFGFAGPYLQLQFGKEWWVSHNWGLGLSAVYHYGGSRFEIMDMDPETNDDIYGVFNQHVLGLLLTATFN